jgi:hypothetical protein
MFIQIDDELLNRAQALAQQQGKAIDGNKRTGVISMIEFLSQISYLTPFRCAQSPLSIFWSGAKNRQVPGVRFALRRTRFALKVNFRDSLKLLRVNTMLTQYRNGCMTASAPGLNPAFASRRDSRA